MVNSIAESVEKNKNGFFEHPNDFLIKSFDEPNCIIEKQSSSGFNRLLEVIASFFTNKKITPYSLEDNITYLSNQEIGASNLESVGKVEKFVTSVMCVVKKKKNENLTNRMQGIIDRAQKERQKLENAKTEELLNSTNTTEIEGTIGLLKSPENRKKLEEKVKNLRTTVAFESLMKKGAAKDQNALYYAQVVEELSQLKNLNDTQEKEKNIMVEKLNKLIAILNL